LTIAVCLLTCGREDLTARTVDSFLAHNRAEGMIRLHADDGSPSERNRQIAVNAGFDTVHAPISRKGQMAGFRALLRAAIDRRAEWLLWLENDWEWVAPIPMDALTLGAECVRLYGALKARTGPRAEAGRFIMGTTDPIVWRPIGGGLERGEAHFAGPPSLTRPYALESLADGARSLKEVSLAGVLDTVRLVDNAVWHIGDTQTPGFVA
jgi:hypothetical protein